MDQPRSVLLLGYRQGVIDACRRLGVQTVTVIDPLEEPGEFLPAESCLFVESVGSVSKVMCALARAGKLHFDAVYTTEEYFVVLAAVLGQIVARPWLDAQVSVAFRDKFYQKQLLRGIVPTADSTFIEDIAQDVDCESISFPVVLKPVTGAGTSFTYAAHDAHELTKIITSHRQRPQAPRSMVIERFVHGEEWHVDGWMSAGELRLFAISTYGFPLLGIQAGGIVSSATLRPDQHPDIYARMHSFLTTTLSTLGLTDGVFHLELFHDPETGRFTFSECAARVGGGMIAQAFQAMFGVDLYEVSVRIALGEVVEAPAVSVQQSAGFTFLPALPPGAQSLPNRSDLETLPGVRQLVYSWAPGEPAPDTASDTTSRTGMVLIAGHSHQEVFNRIHCVVDRFCGLASALANTES